MLSLLLSVLSSIIWSIATDMMSPVATTFLALLCPKRQILSRTPTQTETHYCSLLVLDRSMSHQNFVGGGLQYM